MKTHYLKTWPEYFQDLKSGLKDFEIRHNERDFKIGDEVVCQEYDPNANEYSGEDLRFKIKYIVKWSDNTLMGLALKVNYCVIGLEPENAIRGAMNILINELNKDDSEGSYYYAWQSTIAMAFKDEWEKQNVISINKMHIHEIANTAAKNFLTSLCK